MDISNYISNMDNCSYCDKYHKAFLLIECNKDGLLSDIDVLEEALIHVQNAHETIYHGINYINPAASIKIYRDEIGDVQCNNCKSYNDDICDLIKYNDHLGDIIDNLKEALIDTQNEIDNHDPDDGDELLSDDDDLKSNTQSVGCHSDTDI